MPTTTMARKHDEARAELLARLHDQVATLSSSDAWREWLGVSARFRSYSTSNRLLIWLQRPDATRVAGYRTWQTLGRHVRRGETGIRIVAPMLRRVPDSQSETGIAGDDQPGRVVAGFKLVTVFDVAQTGGKLLPESPAKLLRGDGPEGVLHALEAVACAERLTVHRQQISSGANGYLDSSGRRIVISSTLGRAAAAKTLAHELAHHLDPWLIAQPEGYATKRSECELVAEGAAFIVGDALGLDTTSYSVGYIAGWADGDATRIMEVADRINIAANGILARIEAAVEVVPDAA